MFSEAKGFLKYLEHVPEKYRSGPWSPVTHLVVLAYAAFLMLTLHIAFADVERSSVESQHSNYWAQIFRLFGSLYGFTVIALTFGQLGLWPFFSYTFTSWNLMTLRLACAFMGGFGFHSFQIIGDVLRFPALVGCTVTVTVWWSILVPIIDSFLSKNKQQRKSFWAFNKSFLLVSVHLLNLVLAGAEFLLTGRALTWFDLWVGLFVALMYCLFYLNVLVPNDVHFYIIFSPQTGLCALSYAVILFTYNQAFHGWNYLLGECQQLGYCLARI